VKQTPDSGLSFYGGNGRATVLPLTAVRPTTPRSVRATVSQEAVQEFQINRADYSAELGGARGGVINIVTKSGGNNFHGSLSAFSATNLWTQAIRSPLCCRAITGSPGLNLPPAGSSSGGSLEGRLRRTGRLLRCLRAAPAQGIAERTGAHRLSIFQPTRPERHPERPAAAAAGPLRAALTAPQSTIDLFSLIAAWSRS